MACTDWQVVCEQFCSDGLDKPGFLEHLERCSSCRSDVDKAFTSVIDELHDLGRALNQKKPEIQAI